MSTSSNPTILISLYRGYGLGDAVAMSAVLRHVRQYRPHWKIHYQAEEGFHQVAQGICNHFAYRDPADRPHYDAEVQICLYETFAAWTDRPNTRVTQSLHEHFDLPWDTNLSRYTVRVSPEMILKTEALLFGGTYTNRNPDLSKDGRGGKWQKNTLGKGVVALHYQGDSTQQAKNLTHGQAEQICAGIEHLGYVPVILDWRDRCRLQYRKLCTPSDWGKDAESVCAVIGQCSAFIGIDSGPSKCASATDTPSLVIWTGHHPAVYHDPAPNTTHLVPHGYHGLHPVCNSPGVVQWFEEHYRTQVYKGDPVTEVESWLRANLR